MWLSSSIPLQETEDGLGPGTRCSWAANDDYPGVSASPAVGACGHAAVI